MDDIAIKVEGLSKTFRLPHEKYTSIKSIFVNFYKRKRTYEVQHALRNVSFEVKKGEFFGIVGRNGSGKSTLLRLIAGIYTQTAGNVWVNGKLTPFIELGVGFNPELTARENVFLNGALLGFNRKEMQAMYNEIVEFAELEKFMDQKLKNYSSGMQVRLAFSIAIRARSNVLLIDEVLAVGDLLFQQKCYDTFKEIKKSDRTVIFVSHDLSAVEAFCDRVMVVDRGRKVDEGSPEKMTQVYSKLLAEHQEPGASGLSQNKTPEHVSGSGLVQITKASLLNQAGKAVTKIAAGSPFTIRVYYKTGHQIEKPVFGIGIMDADGSSIIGPNTAEAGSVINQIRGKGYIDAHFRENILAPGEYSIRAAVFEEKGTLPYDFVEQLLFFKVIGRPRHGKVYIQPDWRSG